MQDNGIREEVPAMMRVFPDSAEAPSGLLAEEEKRGEGELAPCSFCLSCVIPENWTKRRNFAF
jgi:hypothetical protein